MMVEFLGLPGSGKTTIGGTCQPLLIKSGVKLKPIGKIAKQQAEKMRGQNRYLNRYAGRSWLFGALAFAKQYPEVYDLIEKSSKHSFATHLWAMDFMANLYFASKADTDGTVIFIDEGFFHRGVSFFFQKKMPTKFQKYLDGTPPCDVLVLFETPAETAFERCLNRGRTPEVYAGKTNAETLNNFAKLQVMQDICKAHQIASGGKVITIDATQPVENSAEILCCELQSLAQQCNFQVRKEEYA